MTTPIKALLQERLRAKIVRQGDDDDAGATADSAASGAPSLAFSTSKVHPCESMVPPPVATTQTRTRRYAAGSVHGRPRSEPPVAFERDLEEYKSERPYAPRSSRPLTGEDTDSVPRGRYHPSSRQERNDSDLHVIRLSGSKRVWQEPQHRRSFSHDDDPEFHHQRPAREVRGDERRTIRRLPVSPPSREMPRKNYDLSSAYQRYRELSSKHGYYSEMPTDAVRDTDCKQYEDMMGTKWSAGGTRHIESSRLEDEYHAAPIRRGNIHKPAVEQRARRWINHLQADDRAPATVDTTNADTLQRRSLQPGDDMVLSTSPQENERRDVHPVHRITPTYHQIATASPGVVSAKRRAVSPRRFSNHFLDTYHEFHQEGENKMVFHTAARAAPAPRSPCRRHILRHEETELSGAPEGFDQSHDEGLSPESQQAAKDFVEKRQKRTSQGTPRTMATHRWLQSMVDEPQAQRYPAAPTQMGNRLQIPALRCIPSKSKAEESNGAHNDGSYDEHEKLPSSTDTAVKSRQEHSYHSDASCDSNQLDHRHNTTLSPVYSPPRRLPGQSFFSSAV